MLLSLAGCPLCATKLSYIKTNFLLTLFTVGGPQPFIIVNQEEDHCQLSIFWGPMSGCLVPTEACALIWVDLWQFGVTGRISNVICLMKGEGGATIAIIWLPGLWPCLHRTNVFMPGATWMIHDNSWQILEYLGLRGICWVRMKILECNHDQEKCLNNFNDISEIHFFHW